MQRYNLVYFLYKEIWYLLICEGSELIMYYALKCIYLN